MKTQLSTPDARTHQKPDRFTLPLQLFVVLVMLLGVAPLIAHALRPWVLGLLLLCPLIIFFLLYRFKPPLTIQTGEGLGLPIMVLLFVTGLVPAIYGFYDHIMHYGSFWIFVPIMMAGYMCVALASAGRDGRRLILHSGMIIILLLSAFTTSYGGAHFINRLTCFTPPAHYTVRILRKEMILNKNNRQTSFSFELDLAPWGPVKSVTTVEVSADVFKLALPPDTISIDLYKGGLGASWYEMVIPQQ